MGRSESVGLPPVLRAQRIRRPVHFHVHAMMTPSERMTLQREQYDTGGRIGQRRIKNVSRETGGAYD